MTESKEISGSQAIAYRNYRRARDRALVRLSHAYPNVYKQYLEEEKAYDEEQGTKWVGIAGRTTVTVGVRTGRSKSGRKSAKRFKNKRAKGRRK